MQLSLTVIIIIITVLASLYAWNNQTVMSNWMMNPYRTDQRKEYWRFITSGLIHNDYMHLFFNMFTLYFFGKILEWQLGATLFIILYVVGIIVSDVPTFFKHKKNPYYNSLGASGGVSAIVFASILLRPLSPLYLFFIPVPIPGFIFGAIYMFYSYYQAERGGDNINHDAHLYGALFGILFTIVAIPSALPNFFEQVSSWNLFN
jgi:membrane associated rhomboid family serine protease